MKRGVELERMERETDELLISALARGTAAVDALAADVLDVARIAPSLDRVGARLDPREFRNTPATAALASALHEAMLTADLLGRAQVARELEAEDVAIEPMAHAFPGQLRIGAQMPSEGFAELGELVVEPLPPTQAIDYFRAKVPMVRTAFDELSDIYRGRAFTIAYQQTTKAVDVVKAWLQQCLDEGLTLKDFREGLDEAAEAGGIRAVNPYHAATVFQTNVQTAYNAGRWELYNAPEVMEAFPFFQYHTVGDDRVRPNHAQMEGYIARRGDPVWDLWWPPNGYNCRCTVTAISIDEARRDNVRPSTRQVPKPDEGFAGNAAKAIRTTGV